MKMNIMQKSKDIIFDKDISVKTKIYYAAALLFTAVMLVLTVAYASQEFNYTKVDAKIADKYTLSDEDNTFYYIAYTFDYNGTEYTTRRRVTYTEHYNAAAGENVKIQIDPKAPSSSIVKGAGMVYGMVDIMAVLAVVGASFLMKKEKEQTMRFRNRNPKNYLQSDFELSRSHISDNER